MKWLKLTLSFVIVALLFVFLGFPHDMIPPMGEFLNPFAGFWQNNTRQDRLPENLDVPGLRADVRIEWDERRVPHIFAANLPDAFMAQGYVTARERLWQMEIQTHATAGRLSEVLGPIMLERDKYQRRIGMGYAAEQAAKAMDDPQTRAIVEAYTAGVNAWIAGLRPEDYPLEYKILDYQPEPWTPLKTALLLKYISWMLTGYNDELEMTRLRHALGDSLVSQWYPNFLPDLEPIISSRDWTFEPVPIPQPLPAFTPAVVRLPTLLQPDPDNGSNNWAVAGHKTRNDNPILASDPHLPLGLPSLWYEIQLVAPELNVYGVSLPGAPGVIIGFNRDVAWGMTNAGSDVMDWYEVEFEDDAWQRYRHDEQWLPTTRRVEAIHVRQQATYFDTVTYTHHGPVVHRAEEHISTRQARLGLALRWAAHDSSNELRAFLQINMARNADDIVAALRHYQCPGQNLAFIDRSGTVGMWHAGKFPLRAPNQGKFISDGRLAQADWTGWIPFEQLPHQTDPARGFVSSANQQPVDERYPYPLGWDYDAFERGFRINDVLSASDSLTVTDMMALQMDVVNVRARRIVPLLLDILAEDSLSAIENQARHTLHDWDFKNTAGQIAPTLFEKWWQKLERLIWEDDLYSTMGTLELPNRAVTLRLLLEAPDDPVFDNRATHTVESRDDIIQLAFRTTLDELTKQHGEFGPAWAWGQVRGTDIRHVGRIPGLGEAGLKTGGHFGIVNATKKTHGPTWRMVVELDSLPRAYGHYSGGQSGNPGSAFYDHQIEDWLTGRYHELIYLTNPDQTHPRLIDRTILRSRP